MGEMDGENGLGHVEELDEGSDLEVVEFADEDGVTYQAAILAVLSVDEQDYAVLAPIDQLQDEEGEELELFLFEFGEDDEGNEFFSYIEDEAIFERVQQAASALLESEETDEVGEA